MSELALEAVLPFEPHEWVVSMRGEGPQALRAAREARLMSIADVAGRTRLTERAIAALEDGHLDAFPGRIYVLGFARAYARAMGVDEAAVDAAFRRLIDTSDVRWRRSA